MTQKERIVEQAMQMFVTQGIRAVRMDDIAQQLGVSKWTLYELFGDKEGLLYQALTCYFGHTRRRREQLSAGAGNVLEALFMVLADVMDTAGETGRMFDNLRKFYPAVYDRCMKEGFMKMRETLRRLLGEGVAQGLFIDRFNIDLAISVLYYTASAIVTRKDLILPEGLSEREVFVQIISNFFRGISTARGLELVDDYLKRYDPAHSRTK